MARVIIVSNRLPVSVKKQDGQLVFSQSTGGVATGLSSYANNPNNRWIGWPGIASDDLTAAERREIERELARHNCIGVFLTKKQIDDFYNGYSNSILWPLFHNLPITTKSKTAREGWFRGYRTVNQLFAQAILRVAQKNSRIWVHDYQLLLVPELLRSQQPAADIGFFSHPLPAATGVHQTTGGWATSPRHARCTINWLSHHGICEQLFRYLREAQCRHHR